MVCSAAQGSRPEPTRPESGVPSARAAGQASAPLRPMNSRRSPVQLVWRPARSAKATRLAEGRVPRVGREHRPAVRIDARGHRTARPRRGTRRAPIPRRPSPTAASCGSKGCAVSGARSSSDRRAAQTPAAPRRCRARRARSGCSPIHAAPHRWPSRRGSAAPWGSRDRPVSSSRR